MSKRLEDLMVLAYSQEMMRVMLPRFNQEFWDDIKDGVGSSYLLEKIPTLRGLIKFDDGFYDNVELGLRKEGEGKMRVGVWLHMCTLDVWVFM